MALRDDLEHLVGEMVARGIRYPDAHREFEKRFIAAALGRANGNVGQAAALLGIHRNTLGRKLAEHRLRAR